MSAPPLAPLASDEPLLVMNDLHPLPPHVAQQLLTSPTLPMYHSTSPDKDSDLDASCIH